MATKADSAPGAPRRARRAGPGRRPDDRDRSGERLLETILGASTALICAHDRAGRCLFVSPALAVVLGLPPSGIVGRTWRDAGLPAEAATTLDDLRQQALTSGGPVTAELALPAAGGPRTLRLTVQPAAGPAGTGEITVATGLDVTEQGPAARAIAESAPQPGAPASVYGVALPGSVEAQSAELRLLHSLLDELPTYVALLTSDYHIAFANRLFRQRFGDSRGRRCFEYLFGYAEPCHNCRAYEVLRTGRPVEWEWRGPDGRCYHIYDFPFTSTDGTPLILETGMDITQLKQAGEEIRRLNAELEQRVIERTRELSEAIQALRQEIAERARAQMERERLLAEVQRRAAELDATISAISDGLIITDASAAIVRMNEAALRILGVGAGFPPGSEQHLALLGEGSPLDRALHGERVLASRLRILRPDGQHRELLVNAGPIREGEELIRGAIMTFADITPIIELQEQWEDMLRAVSHDLRNPLTGIYGQAQLVERRLLQGTPPERIRESVRWILRSARRMNTMIGDLVDSARSEHGQLRLSRRPIDLPAFLQEYMRERAATMEADRIHMEPTEPLPPVLADPDRLERIFDNLLSNALKYSDPATAVTVSFRQRAGHIVTSITDRGPGIAPDEASHLFERYYRGRAAREGREGLGLGLYVTRLLVEAHGGEIWVRSELDVGSTFSFSLPIAGEEELESPLPA
ncbi:MAG: PAS domain-containing protein [Anaerolineae bacterium]|nr:PAS domain-containing protein [Anaerolineae bacterium]